MRKVIATTFISMDGVMQGPGGPEEDTSGGFTLGGWTEPYFDEEGGAFIGEALQGDYALLLGRRTYEIFAAHWPHYDDEIGRKFNAVTKYVAAGPDTAMTWAGSVRLEGDAAEAVAALKAEDGPDLLIQGSGVLIQSLLRAGLIDRMSLMIFPVLLGAGKRLFDDGARPAEFTLTRSGTTPSGVMVATYERSGDVRTGSFAMQEPSEAELARRARMAREG